ncbi:alpha/beta fold hydrolase [Vitiosangium sp. GDMCC 1.1324]|uniref:alpha/beta fold hydrolase n=1 Tax=Vitiosangium sp. (strain GDMCC 1.1324) TaxID=2138576 RepID=UPI000D3D33AF|nr:alpha/beta hydrolase [Vitiosangium sp. GDMCC 1.1324]PTL81169.1 alpha/beta hydrolase [Vitiosangium sp. GDMCC 1.1324]
MKNLPQRREVTIEGRRLTYSVAGQGKPPIVLINGAGGPLEGWYKLYPAIEKLGTVVAYDRPGVGGSSRPTEPQTGEVVVRTLRRLLHELGIEGPYVMVGHSFGGLFANLFARLYPKDVMGVVFLEATAPDDIGMMKAHQSRAQRVMNGALNFFSRPEPNDEISNEARTVAQIAEAPAFPDVPLRVVSGGKTPPGWLTSAEALRLRARHQEALASLSSQGERIVADRSGHFPQMSQPELVLDAIAQVVGKHAANP